MGWLLILVLIFPNGREMVARKPIDTETECIETAHEAVAAALNDGLTIRWKCQPMDEDNINEAALKAADQMTGE